MQNGKSRALRTLLGLTTLLLAGGWEDCAVKPKTVIPECEGYPAPWAAGDGYYCVQGNDNDIVSHSGHSKYAFDFAMPQGTPILASRAGTVVDTRDDATEACPIDKDCPANIVRIDHGDGTYGMYVHLLYRGVFVEPGQYVQQGEFIAFSGHTGISTFPHLHFVVYEINEEGKYWSIPIYIETDTQACTVPQAGHWVKSGLQEVEPAE